MQSINFPKLDFVLKQSFNKVKRDIKRLEEANRVSINDLAVIRQNLIEANSLKRRIEELEKKLGNKGQKSSSGFFSRLFSRKNDAEYF